MEEYSIVFFKFVLESWNFSTQPRIRHPLHGNGLTLISVCKKHL